MNDFVKIRGHAAMSGHFTLTRRGPDGKVRQRLEFDNLITDLGLDQLVTSPGYAYGFAYPFAGCCVGTGNTTPAVTDTTLAAFLASTGGGDQNGTVTYVAGPPAYWKDVLTYRFGTGVAAGNLTEIGIFPTNLNETSLGARALVLDGGGAPTALVVLADEILDVTYERRVYLDTTDTSSTFTINGVVYNTVQRLSQINSPPLMGRQVQADLEIVAYAGALGTVLQTPASPAYAITYNNGATVAPYVNGNHYIDVTTTAPVGDANFTDGIQAITFTSKYHQFQMSFIDPLTGKGIPKVTGQKLTVAYRFSWARYTP
jgi:hypothetical protein